MKPWLFIFAMLAITTIASCKKADIIENVGIVGKWQLIEVFNGYANGGDFTWSPVSIDNAHTITFTQNGEYNKKENLNGNNQECIGTYSFQTSNNLEVNSNCNTITEKMFVSELSTNSLILDQSVIEGKIRYKYSASR
ncbi:hypothetical protein [Limnovirga soli]|uniref:Lipocalin-like domain-containing protein n=1 Tax=Limnovirga soli TaxID=2656915 RepID=A0A8J8FA23_9BACT|nr:hypothetical protein [Limnovirga soli]NNV54116.1 hypothetical protein [Limnovirga soli]